MFIGLFFSSRRRHTRCALVTEFRRVLFRSLPLGVTEGRGELGNGTTLWLECNAAELNGVSFSKGCYVGQENTARMNWRQKVNRRLVVVPIAAAEPARQVIAYPELGWSVEHRRVEAIDGGQAPGRPPGGRAAYGNGKSD